MAPVVIDITTDSKATLSLLTTMPAKINVAMRQGMTDATVLLLREAATYPPPPAAIQGPARVPAHVFRAGYMTQSGVKAFKTVMIRANKMKGKNIKMVSAERLRYRRTNTLKRSWHRVITGDGFGIVGRVYSSGAEAPYNRYVQDEDLQARIHQGRWRTAQQISKDNQGNISKMFQARIAAAIK